MISERPVKSKIQDDAEEDLFQGLSFPEVPTAPVAPTTLTYIKDVITPESSQTNRIIITPESTITSCSNSTLNKENERRKTNLAALYATEVLSLDSIHTSMYPELPSFSIRSGEDEENSAETTSLLHRQSNTLNGTLLTIGNKTNKSSNVQNEDPELVTDLMRENSRLAGEVANLRRILQDQQQENADSRARNALISSTLDSNSIRTDSNRVAGADIHTSDNTITGVQIADATRPPEKGVKYVCCGGCRQWLMAPRDSTYVVCSSCGSINNCNLAPKDHTEAHNRATETRALTQRNGSDGNMFWFLDCFSRGLF